MKNIKLYRISYVDMKKLVLNLFYWGHTLNGFGPIFKPRVASTVETLEFSQSDPISDDHDVTEK